MRITNKSTKKTFTVTVTTAGTPVQFDSYPVDNGVEIVVRAHPDNTGRVFVGVSSATALSTSGQNDPLNNNQSVSYQLQNTNGLWADAAVSGEKVIVSFEQ